MNTLWLLFEGAWHVLLAGLILGAGLPAVFALGVRAWSWGSPTADTITQHRPHLTAKVLAMACFLVVLCAIAFGIGIIVTSGFGLDVQFGWPIFVPK